MYVSRYRQEDKTLSLVSVFNALGALAGFGCQSAVREGFIKPGLIPEDKAFITIRTKDGGCYFFGDLLNILLLGNAQNCFSVWSLVAGAAQHVGTTDFFDIQEIATHNAKNVGTEEFGIPKEIEKYEITEKPLDILKRDWPTMQELLHTYAVNPKNWGESFALAAQYLILKNEGDIVPVPAVRIIMEAAMPMPKIDPDLLVVTP